MMILRNHFTVTERSSANKIISLTEALSKAPWIHTYVETPEFFGRSLHFPVNFSKDVFELKQSCSANVHLEKHYELQCDFFYRCIPHLCQRFSALPWLSNQTLFGTHLRPGLHGSLHQCPQEYIILYKGLEWVSTKMITLISCSTYCSCILVEVSYRYWSEPFKMWSLLLGLNTVVIHSAWGEDNIC